MKRNMQQWVSDVIAAPVKQTLPVLSFPCIQLLDISVRELISSAELQAQGMKKVADRAPTAASVSLMDLSVEAECFGSTIHTSDHEVPTVRGAIIAEPEDADTLQVPPIGTCRTGLYIDAIRKAAELITDRPVFAGVIGPFSLAARLTEVEKIMFYCFDEPEMVETVMEKVTQYLIDYCQAYKEAGANGVVMAEPVTGLLSPAMAEEFSHPYVKKIIDAVQDESFAVVYHNCGSSVTRMAEEIFDLGAMGYHFGDAIKMEDILPHAPANVLVMGNVSPARTLCEGTPDSVREETLAVLKACSQYPNFVLSSGCDIPPKTPWENIDAFFAAANEYFGA